MATQKMDKLIWYGAAGFALYSLYGMAMTGALGEGALTFASQLRNAWGDTPGKLVGLPGTGGSGSQLPAGSGGRTVTVSQPKSGLLATKLTDWGGVPVVYNAVTRSLQQDPAWVAANAPGYSPNVYTSGIFKGPNGETVSFADAGAYILAQA